MPSAEVAKKPSKITDELLKGFIDKLRESGNKENILDLWETELKSEAKKVFTLLSVEMYENSVYKELEGLPGNKLMTSTEHKTKSVSRSSIRRSLTGSGSSITSKMRSMSFIDIQMDLYNKVKQNS